MFYKYVDVNELLIVFHDCHIKGVPSVGEMAGIGYSSKDSSEAKILSVMLSSSPDTSMSSEAI